MGAKAKLKTAIVFGVLIIGSGLVALGVSTTVDDTKPKSKSAQKYTPPATVKGVATEGVAYAAVGSAVMADKSKGWWDSVKAGVSGWFDDKPAPAAPPVAVAPAARPAVRVAAVAPVVAASAVAVVAPVAVAPAVVDSAPAVAAVKPPVAPAVPVAPVKEKPAPKPSPAPAQPHAVESTPDLDKLIGGLDGLLKK